MHQLFTDAGVRKYLWDDEVIPRDRTASIVETSIASFDAHAFGLWAITQSAGVRLQTAHATADSRLPARNTHALIGFCGFWHFHEPPQLELLYGLAPSAWRKGLATEAATAMIRYGFDRLSFTRVDASTDGAHVESVRVMERAGMIFWKREMTNGLDTIYYSILREG